MRKNSKITGMVDAVARLEALKLDAVDLTKQLEEQVKLARGTADLERQAALARQAAEGQQAPAPIRVGGMLSMTLTERIQSALTERPLSIEDLARDLREPVGKVSAAIKNLRKSLYNVGTDSAPAWFWIVGDDAPTERVNAAIRTLIHYSPMSFQDLTAATGVRHGRISGAIIAMQRDEGSRVTKLPGPSGKIRWFAVPDGVPVTRLRKPSHTRSS